MVSRRLAVPLVFFACLATVALFRQPREVRAQADAEKDKPASIDKGGFRLAGSPSCSALSCHGRIEASGGAVCNQNEQTIWSRRDPHVQAYDVLFNDRSLRMAALLKLDKPPHEDATCLACHTHPLAAVLPADKAAAEIIATERRWGVGCESCHGAASGWLVEHTSLAWRDLTPMQKAARGMVPMEDLAAQFRNCAGCHVGDTGGPAMPRREVTHDLIAAGHPQMRFEPSTFLANLPPHWRTDVARRLARADGQTWALGQLVLAKASLTLTRDRLDRVHAWPELAEFSCFACHHDLQPESWRQQRDLDLRAAKKKAGRAGDMPWSSWAWVGPTAIAGSEAFHSPGFAAAVEDLTTALSAPSAAREKVEAPLIVLEAELEKLRRRILLPWPKAQTAGLLPGLFRGAPKGALDWDHAEQLYLGALAANQDVRLNGMPAFQKDVETLRAFPKDWDSPRAFDPARFKAAWDKLAEMNRTP